jgi:hypothetical protein
MTVPRNGVFYTIDARTGKEVLPPRGVGGTAYPPLKQFDLSTLSAGYQDSGQSRVPATGFGHGWFPMGYDPETGLVYISAYETRGGGSGGRGPTLEADGLGPGGEAAELGGSAQGVGFNMLSILPSLTASSSRSTLSSKSLAGW